MVWELKPQAGSLYHGKKESVGKTCPTMTNWLRGTGFPAGHSGTTGWKWLCHCPTTFYNLQVCHPERRLPESKDLAAAVFAAVICPGATMRR